MKSHEIEFICSCCGRKTKKYVICWESQIAEYEKRMSERDVCSWCHEMQDRAVESFISATNELLRNKNEEKSEELAKKQQESYNECKRWKVVR
jgi:hypothetical protein